MACRVRSVRAGRGSGRRAISSPAACRGGSTRRGRAARSTRQPPSMAMPWAPTRTRTTFGARNPAGTVAGSAQNTPHQMGNTASQGVALEPYCVAQRSERIQPRGRRQGRAKANGRGPLTPRHDRPRATASLRTSSIGDVSADLSVTRGRAAGGRTAWPASPRARVRFVAGFSLASRMLHSAPTRPAETCTHTTGGQP